MILKSFVYNVKKNKKLIVLLVLVIALLHFSSFIIKNHQIKIQKQELEITRNLINLLILIIIIVVSPGFYYQIFKNINDNIEKLSFWGSIKNYIGSFLSASIFIGILYFILLIPYFILHLGTDKINIYLNRFLYEVVYIFLLYITAFVLPIIFLKNIDGYDAIWFSVEFVIKNIKFTLITLLIIIIERIIKVSIEISMNFFNNEFYIWSISLIDYFKYWLIHFSIFIYAVLLLEEKDEEVKQIIEV